LFSPTLGFHVKRLCTVYVYDLSFVHCLFTLQILDDNDTLIINKYNTCILCILLLYY